MYKSPIEIVVSQVQEMMLQKQEEQTCAAIQKVGINVDKEELLKALHYDREQYNKGYMDGAKEFAERLENAFGGFVLCDYNFVCNRIHNILKEMVGEDK